MVPVNEGRLAPEGWISLRRVEGLRQWRLSDRDAWIGAGVTFAELAAVPALAALAAASRTVGSPQIRNAATIGGNVATASPAGDSLPVLLCYDAQVDLVSVAGRRRVPLDEFLVGPKATLRRDEEVIAGLFCRGVTGRQVFSKVGPRNAMVIAVCSLAARLDLDRGEARCAIGAAAPTARRVAEAEPLLLVAGPRAATAFSDAVAAAAQPIDDHRGSAAYRRRALAVLARRAHAWLWSPDG